MLGLFLDPPATCVVAGRPLAALAEPLNFGVVGPDDPPSRRLGLLVSGDPAALDPGEQRDRRHLKQPSQVGQPPLVLAEPVLPVPVLPVPVRWNGSSRMRPRPISPWAAQPPQELLEALLPEAVAALGGPVALGVEAVGDRRRR